MFTDTITLFNFQNGVWFPHIIHGADAAGITEGASRTTANGTVTADSGTILIQTDSRRRITTSAGVLEYLPPKAYAALDSGENAVTLQPQKDIVLIGEYQSTKPIVDDDFEMGFFDELNSGTDGVYQVVSAAYYSLIPHFEIGVK